MSDLVLRLERVRFLLRGIYRTLDGREKEGSYSLLLARKYRPIFERLERILKLRLERETHGCIQDAHRSSGAVPDVSVQGSLFEGKP